MSAGGGAAQAAPSLPESERQGEAGGCPRGSRALGTSCSALQRTVGATVRCQLQAPSATAAATQQPGCRGPSRTLVPTCSPLTQAAMMRPAEAVLVAVADREEAGRQRKEGSTCCQDSGLWGLE